MIKSYKLNSLNKFKFYNQYTMKLNNSICQKNKKFIIYLSITSQGKH